VLYVALVVVYAFAMRSIERLQKWEPV